MPAVHSCSTKFVILRSIATMVLVSFFALQAIPCLAIQPPRPGEVDELKQRNVYQRQLDHAERLDNHLINPVLLKRAINRGKRAILRMRGLDSAGVDNIAPLYTPPPAWEGLPTTGNVRILALLIEFQDYTHAAENTRDYVHSNIFGTGDPARYPYESLASYYDRSSYSQLDLSSGNTLGWYQTAYDRPIDDGGPDAWEIPGDLIKEVMNYYDSQGHDFTQYDNNNDGVIDYFAVFWTGPPGEWASVWWGWQWNFVYLDNTFTIDGKKLGDFSWQWEASPVGSSFNPRVVIHETGHALGLPDLYDYNSDVGPDGGVGGLDMMDATRGDHNSFSKWVLDWLTPSFVASGIHPKSMQPSGTSQDCVVIWPGIESGDLFSEFFVAQNRQREGNDNAPGIPGDGMLLWHIDATLDPSGQYYLYNNSNTEHKLVRLMEADGLEEIEQELPADVGDYWKAGDLFDLNSIPSTRMYNGTDSHVSVYDYSDPAIAMNATFEISSQAADDGWTDDGLVVRLTTGTDNVGIGTDSPDGKLHVDVDGDGNGDLFVEDDGPRKGNVGIGTKAPAHKLTLGDKATPERTNYVEVNSSTWAGMLFHGGGRGGSIMFNHPGNYLYFGTSPGDGTGPWERMRITSTGNVGIGTSIPASKLDVAGTINVSGFKMPASASNGYVLTSDAAGEGTWQPSPGISGSGSGNFLAKFEGSNSIGNSAIYDNSGSIGIGTKTPGSRKLKVVGDVEISSQSPTLHLTATQESPARMRYADSDAASSQYFDIYFNAADQDLHFQSDEIESMKLTNDGIIYFTPKNLHKTHPSLSASQFVIGWNHSGGRGETVFYQHGGGGYRSGYDFWSERNGVAKKCLARLVDNGNLKLLGSVGSISDAREKDNIRSLSNALTKVMALRGVYFNWKDEKRHDDKTHIGLIAQEVLEVVPEVVMGGPRDNGEDELYSLQYDRLIPVLIEAVKEQQRIILDLQNRIGELETQISKASVD
jgi:M6 family metalloprotease-like protein